MRLRRSWDPPAAIRRADNPTVVSEPQGGGNEGERQQMTSPIGTDPPQQTGVFWIASDPNEKRNGCLHLGREAALELIVNPEFYPGVEITDIEVTADGSAKSSIGFAKDRGPQTLHGRLTHEEPGESVPVSILQAHSTRWSGPNQTFRPIWSLVGGHVEPLHPFRGLRLRIPRYGPRTHDPVPLVAGGTARIDTNGGWLELVDLPPRSYRELERTLIRPICTLLTLATGERIRPSHVQLSPHPGTWWPVYTASQADDNPTVADPLIRPSDISIDVLATWLDQAHVLGPLPAGIASLWETNLAVETQVLILTTIAEGLHRALHPEALRFTREHGRTIRTIAVAAVRQIDTDAADAVNGYLDYVHEVGYGTRLRDLAARAEELVPGITGDPTRWKNLVYATRNKYAHQPSTEWLDEADIDRVLAVTQSLSWVLRLLLLDQAGLDPGLISNRFRLSEGYSFFISDAAEWQPRIYSKTPDRT
jgi:Apea-like HEPN